ncbi:MAG: RNA 3'-terminal phosphate cyclase [Caldilineaceae bacterium]
MTIHIDGSLGEGGGQVLRTSLALSALTGQPMQIDNIRARRRNPGLAAQHLAGVKALARVCGAEVKGASIHSSRVDFTPSTPAQAGQYVFDISTLAGQGSAGAVTLLLQTLLWPLLFAEGESHLTLRGGTHVAWSPPVDYVRDVLLPTLAPMGVDVTCELTAWGFYPVGGGELQVTIRPVAEPLRPLILEERGALERVSGVGVAAELPAHIAQRISSRATNVLKQAQLPASITAERVRSPGPGAGIFLTAEYAASRAGFSALGKQGKPSDAVADEACEALLTHHMDGAPVDPHLADQILVPLALAAGKSVFRTSQITQHLLTNADVIRAFIDAEIVIDGGAGGPGTVTVVGSGR